MEDRANIDTLRLERRHLTVLECDLVGSTALAHKLDPEELRDLILAYQDSVLTWVKKLDGYFVQFAGDAVWVYFGYPNAHEDDACRAIRAGLGMAATVGSINLYGKTLSVRVGIASGLCVVGNMRQKNRRNTKGTYWHNMDNQITAFGNPPNLAARLQVLAKPGSVAIAEETHSLAGNLFKFEDLGFYKIKGFTSEIRAWCVVGESGEPNRFRALRPHTKSPLIGRANELKALTSLWKESCKGKGQVVYLSGEPGIGKSRLIASVAEDVVELDHPQWWLHCGEYLQGSAFAPIITLIQAQARISDSDEIRIRFEKLVKRYSNLDNDALYLLAELLSIEEGSNLTVPQISASRRRERLYEVLIELIEVACQHRSLLFIVEDMHWIDPSTQALLQRITLRSEKLPILLLIASRTINDSEKSFMELSHVHEFSIEQLQRGDCFALLNALWNEDEIPTAFAEQIVNQTDGVPLFIEDVIFALLYTAENTPGDITCNEITVPAKLSEHLMSRIDNLGDSKYIAQVGSVAGREFSLEMMESLTSLTTSVLKEKVAILFNAGLIIPSEHASVPGYVFKHAMIRDAAYDSLLISDRMELHSRIATWLESEQPSLRQSQPETIAYHYKNAGAFDLAVHYWLEAGQYSNRRSNYVEASIHLKNAHKLIPELVESTQRDRTELDIITALGVAYAGTSGISGEETGKVYDKARQLCKILNYPSEIFPILSGACSFHFLRSDYDKVREIAKQSIQLATKKANTKGIVIGNRMLGAVQFITAEFNTSINSLQTAINIYDKSPKFHQNDALAYALDQKTSSLCYLSLANVAIGKIDTALDVSLQSLNHSEKIDQHCVNYALCYQAAIRHLRDDSAEIIMDVATRSLKLALKEGYVTWVGISRLLKGEAVIRLGYTDEGMRDIKQGVLEHSNLMAQTFLPLAQSVLVKGYIAIKEYDKALEVLAEAEALTLRTKQLWYLPEVQRLFAEIRVHQGQYAAAHDGYQKAWSTANGMGAKFWQLKIACSMANNKNFVKRYNHTYKLLAEAIAGVEEGKQEPILLKAAKLAKTNEFERKFID